MGKKIIAVIVVGVIVATGLWMSQQTQSQPQQQPTQKPITQWADRSRVGLKISDYPQLTVELVNTPASITLGLSGRDEIGADGMLFVMSETKIHSFWMKEMKFDLDMVWIRDGKVVDITHNVPAPSSETPLSKLPTYHPNQPANMVLELPADMAKTIGITIGDSVVIRPPLTSP